LLVGGVACNSELRRAFKETFEQGREPVPVYYPSPCYTTDNGVMIAAAGAPKLMNPPPLDLDLNAYASLRLC
jgi:tRNA A37 threonylcarbamoyltransferase TsaD